MRRGPCLSALALSLLSGVARAMDLIANTDSATGFLRVGSVVPCYGLLLLCLLRILWAAHAVPVCPPDGQPPRAAAWLRGTKPLLLLLSAVSILYGCCVLFGLLPGAADGPGGHHARDELLRVMLELLSDKICAALFAVFGLWCLLLALGDLRPAACSKRMFGLGIVGSMAFYADTILQFLQRPSSLYRILPVVEILSALSALLFVAALLRALYLPASPFAARSLCRGGLLAFFCCTCLALPQAVWQYAVGVEQAGVLLLAAVLGCTGLWGAVCALRAAVWADADAAKAARSAADAEPRAENGPLS